MSAITTHLQRNSRYWLLANDAQSLYLVHQVRPSLSTQVDGHYFQSRDASDFPHGDKSYDQEIRTGGNATAAGMAFQANVAAQFSLGLLTERSLDARVELGDAKAVSVRCETEAPVDDILIETSLGGFVFIQAKTTLDFSGKVTSGLGL